MKRVALTLAFVFTVPILICSGMAVASDLSGEKLYRKARALENGADYFRAFDTYKQAKSRLLKEGNMELADLCRFGLLRMEKIKLSYTHTEQELRRLIQKKYPLVSDARIDEIMADGRLPRMIIGGKTYYFDESLNTLYHLYLDFRTREESGALGLLTNLFDLMSRYIYSKETAPNGQVYFNPITYEAKGEMTLPRNKLPRKGLLKVWLPLPLVTPAQPNVKILDIYPEKYIRFPLKLAGNIGLGYMEIPLEEIQENLKIGVKFNLTHYEERFDIDPNKIGEYDTNSSLYKHYTASGKNISITPAIRATARRIAADETNPYLIAKRFYEHVVYNLEYSLLPHAAIDALEIPESVYVHEHGYGDCGAQSIYFAALCRSVGIPARSAGGMQLFPNQKSGCGDHFWAQVYFPNYGWIPVDTSVGQLAKYIPKLTKEQRTDFIDYYFGKMDPFRYLIQVNVDAPLIPRPEEPRTFKLALQSPTGECREMDISPGILFMENWKVVFKQQSEAD